MIKMPENRKNTINEKIDVLASLNILKKNYRGFIQSKDSIYYILNELVSGEYTKVFSAVKINENSRDKVENQKYCVRYLSKAWIKTQILKKLQVHEDKTKKFFFNLKKKFDSYKNISHPNIQDLKDYIEDDDGIYIISEFCDYTLKDYLQILREPIKFTRFPFEVKVRKLMVQILDTMHHMQSEMVSMCFGGIMSSSDIMVSEVIGSSSDKSSNAFLVKFPHPFMSDMFTIFKIYNLDRFPSFYAPEIYELFQSDEITKAVDKKDSFDLFSLVNKINQNMDMWSLGFLLYEILFEEGPFDFDNLQSAVDSLKSNFIYNIYPKRISRTAVQIITRCLQRDPQDRLKTDPLLELKNDMKKENESLEDLEKRLRERMNDKKDYDMISEFDLVSFNDYERY